MREAWKKAPLSSLAVVERGVSWSKGFERSAETDRTTPVLRIGNVQPDGLRLDDRLYLEGVRIPNSKRLSANSLVMVGSNGNANRVGNVCCAGRECERWAYASFLIGVHPDTKLVDPAFLYYALASEPVQRQITDATSGSTGLKNIGLTWMRGLQLDIPLMQEQRRIASLLQAVDRQIELSVVESVRAFGLLEALRRQVIDLSDREPRPLSDFLKAIDGGRSLRSLERPPVPGERAVLKVSAVKPGLFVASEAKALPDDASMPSRAVVRDGDVLMTRANTAELVGAVCRVTPPCDNLYLSDKTLRLVFDEDKAVPAYFVHALAAPSVRRQLALVATGTSGSMKNVSQEKIRSLQVRAPVDVAEQRLLLDAFDAVLALARLADQRSAALRELRSSLIRVLLSGAHQIPESYDRFLAEIAA